MWLGFVLVWCVVVVVMKESWFLILLSLCFWFVVSELMMFVLWYFVVSLGELYSIIGV